MRSHTNSIQHTRAGYLLHAQTGRMENASKVHKCSRATKDKENKNENDTRRASQIRITRARFIGYGRRRTMADNRRSR
jgi:hypothetical protein